jgi:hypothetical protein
MSIKNPNDTIVNQTPTFQLIANRKRYVYESTQKAIKKLGLKSYNIQMIQQHEKCGRQKKITYGRWYGSFCFDCK